MTDPALLVVIGSAGTAGIGLATATALKGWRGWLDVRRLELGGSAGGAVRPSAGARIEIARLRERVRRLESIANGGEA